MSQPESDTFFDVAIVGCGPVGLVSAALLAQAGHRVVALERHPARYSLPRAGHIDHEVMRILQGIGAQDPILRDAPEPADYVWYNGNGDVLLRFPFAGPSISGYQSDFMIFQPVLDDAIYDRLASLGDRVSLRLGHDVVALEEAPDGVTITTAGMELAGNGRRQPTGVVSRVRARYVIAADGASSSVRELLHIQRSDDHIDEAWYTVDCRIKRELPPNIDGQWCDPTRPTYIGPLGRRYHRFEMKLLPGERPEDFHGERAWEMLARWGVGPDDVEIFRDVVYSFQARFAERWNTRRIILAGDAAHTMPPFMGQGLCSGFRDAANISWKLDLVLRGIASESLLDTYQSEREPHVERWKDISMAVGAISCELDPERAAERDREFLAGTHDPLPGPPAVGPGAFVGAEEGFAEIAERIFPQATVRRSGREGLFHDVLGSGFFVVSRATPAAAQLSRESRLALQALGASLVEFGGSAGAVEDVSGTYAAYFDGLESDVVIVRPDYLVFGAASGDRADELVSALAELLRLAVDA